MAADSSTSAQRRRVINSEIMFDIFRLKIVFMLRILKEAISFTFNLYFLAK